MCVPTFHPWGTNSDLCQKPHSPHQCLAIRIATASTASTPRKEGKGKWNKRVRARASKSLTAQYFFLSSFHRAPHPLSGSLYMADNLVCIPDTTTEEFNQVWRGVDSATKDERPLSFQTVSPLGNIPHRRFDDGSSPIPDLIPHGHTKTFLNIDLYAYFCSGLHIAYYSIVHAGLYTISY